MSPRRLRQLLILLTMALLAASGYAGWRLLQSVTPPAPPPADSRVAGGDQGASRDTALPSLAAFEPLTQLQLNRRLYDPPPPAPPPPAPPPPLTVTLAGTIVEPGRNRAMFITRGGEYELKAIGETADGAEILAIDESSVRLRHHGEEVTLEVKEGS